MPPDPTAINLPSAWTRLQQFARPRPVAEQCELCSEQLPAEHPHLVEPSTRQILCACNACAVLFTDDGQTRYRRIPRDIWSLPTLELTEADWAGLRIPIGLAFFFYSSPAQRMVAIYPSPAGPTESLLELEAWTAIAQGSAALQRMQPDVEALLINRTGERNDCLLVPIDECYKLVGLVRTHWHGLSGGDEMWETVKQFFATLTERARPAKEG